MWAKGFFKLGKVGTKTLTDAEARVLASQFKSVKALRKAADEFEVGSQGRLFEHWILEHQFGSMQTRLKISEFGNPKKLAQLLQPERTCDHIRVLREMKVADRIVKELEVWEFKFYHPNTTLPWLQMADYRTAMEAGELVSSMGNVIIRSVNYVFPDRKTAMRAVERMKGEYPFEVHFIDDSGILQFLR